MHRQKRSLQTHVMRLSRSRSSLLRSTVNLFSSSNHGAILPLIAENNLYILMRGSAEPTTIEVASISELLWKGQVLYIIDTC
jgi:hypothetical protein